MTTPDDLEKALRSWAEAITGRETFVENRMGNRPPDPYATIFLSDIAPMDHDVNSLSEDGLTETLRGLSIVTVRATLWQGDDAREKSRLLHGSLQSDARWTDLWATMGRLAVNSIRDLSDVSHANRRPRFEFTFTVSADLSITFGSEYFDRVEIDGKVIGIDNPPDTLNKQGCEEGN